MKTQSCPMCGTGTMTFCPKARTIKYKGDTAKVRVTGWWCGTESCDEGILTGAELVKFGKALRTLKAKVEGVIPPGRIAEIRAKLRLSQRRASEIFGGGPKSFQKYESGHQTPSVPMSKLLMLVDGDPTLLHKL